MKIENIEPGKKYWKQKTEQGGRKAVRKVQGIAVYVLEVDKSKVRILASLNGSPAQWFTKKDFGQWIDKDPTT